MLSQAELNEAMNLMTPAERQELHRLLALDAKLWKPTPGPQQMALESKADVLLYGGAAGGGKSDLMLGLAINYHQQSIIFRRAMSQTKALITRAKKIVGDKGENFNKTEAWYTLPDRDGLPPDRFMRFGSVNNDGDEERYQGNPHDFVGFDEGAHFSEELFRYLTGWNRSDFEGDPKYPNFRCRIVVASNPPMDVTGDWMFDYWAPWLDPEYPNPAMPGELRWFVRSPVDERDIEVHRTDKFVWVTNEKGEATKEPNYNFDPEEYKHPDKMKLVITPRSRTFVPARVTDNPYYRNGGYLSNLQSMTGDARRKLLDGEFKKSTEEDRMQVIPRAWVKAAMDRWTEKDANERGPLSAIGVDVARKGIDSTCLAKRYGNWVDELITKPGRLTPDGPAVADMVLAELEPGAQINIDGIGVGSAVVDVLNLLDVENVNPIIVSESSGIFDKAGIHKLRNLRAEIYWNMRELLDPESGHEIALPKNPQLMADLCAATWRSTPSGLLIELKEEIKKRIKRSPDLCDAVLLAFYEPTSEIGVRVSSRFSKRR